MRSFRHKKVEGDGRNAPTGPADEDEPQEWEAAIPVPSSANDDTPAPPDWYPDLIDPGMVRYWGGAAWTEQTRPFPPPSSARVGDALGAPPDEAVTPSAEPLPGLGAIQPDSAHPSVGETPVSDGYEEDTSYWAKEAEKAVARARSANTPEAWGAAAQAASVVIEMSQTMQLVADAKALADHRAQAAEHAAEEARLAAKAAADAKRKTERRASEAREAARAAEDAHRAAADAKRVADRSAETAPEAAQAARVAADVAVAARRTAQELEQIREKAQAAKAPEAWSHARQLATAAWAMAAGEDHALRPSAGDSD